MPIRILVSAFLILIAAFVHAQTSCNNPIQLNCGSPVAVVINSGVGSDNSNYCGFVNDGNEFYLSFTPTITGEYVGILEDGASNVPVEIRYKNASTTCAVNDWNCATSGPIVGGMSTNPMLLTQGETYVICVDLSSSGDAFSGQFEISCIVPPPGNDQCSNAAFLGCESIVSGTLNGATTDNVTIPYLASATTKGVWYMLQGSDTYTSISTCSNLTNFDTQISIFTGACNNLTCIAANDDDPNCSNPNSSRISFNASSGVTYYVYVHGVVIQNESADFQLAVSCSAPCNAPSNDLCENAISLGTLTNFNCVNSQFGNTQCATQPEFNPNGISNFYTLHDVWYSFTNASNLLEIQLDALNSAQIGYALYEGVSCNSLLGPISVEQNISSVGGDYFENPTAGASYYLQLFSIDGEAGEYNLCLTQATCTEPGNFNVSGITASTAQFSWTNYQPGTSFDLYYTSSPADIPGTTASIYGINLPFYNLIGLNEFTTYYAYVRNNCANGESEWVGPLTFTTAWNTPDCSVAPALTCSSMQTILFEGAGSFYGSNCFATGGREYIFKINSNLHGTYAIESTNSNAFKVYVKEDDGSCDFSNATCGIQQGNRHHFSLNQNTDYLVLLDGITTNIELVEFTLLCPNQGDDISNAQQATTSNYPVCYPISSNLNSNLLSLEAGTLTRDAYYKFQAISPGVSIKLNCDLSNGTAFTNLALMNSEGTVIDTETSSSTGSLVINSSTLTIGETYFVRVMESNIATNTNFTLCIRTLKSGSCGSNPSFNLNLGNYFVAGYSSGCSYRFSLTGTSGLASGNNYIKNQSSPLLVLANVFPSLPYDCDYSISVSNIYQIPTSSGNIEIVQMPSVNSCSIHINPQPQTYLRAVDRCNVQSKPRISWIAANTFVLSCVGYRWEFQKLDNNGNNVGAPIVHTTTRSNQFVNLGNVSQLEYDTHYMVKCAPQFSYGAGNSGLEYELCISPFSGIIGDNTKAIDTENIENSSLIFPNPATSYFELRRNLEVKNIRIYNSLGQLVIESNSNIATFDISHLPVGIYAVEIVGKTGKSTEKLFISR
jgi:hypothetical protein